MISTSDSENTFILDYAIRVTYILLIFDVLIFQFYFEILCFIMEFWEIVSVTALYLYYKYEVYQV